MHLSSPKKHQSKTFGSLMLQQKDNIKLQHESLQLANRKRGVMDAAHKEEYKDQCFAAPNGAKIIYVDFYAVWIGATQ